MNSGNVAGQWTSKLNSVFLEKSICEPLSNHFNISEIMRNYWSPDDRVRLFRSCKDALLVIPCSPISRHPFCVEEFVRENQTSLLLFLSNDY
jgi:hypothetical protein